MKRKLKTRLEGKYRVGRDPRRKEYPLDYKKLSKKLKIGLKQNPRSDAWLHSEDFDELVLLEFEMRGCATWTVAKLWYYIKSGGRFDELGQPKKIRILHFLSNELTPYDKFVAEGLSERLKESAKAKTLDLKYSSRSFELSSDTKKTADRLVESICELLQS